VTDWATSGHHLRPAAALSPCEVWGSRDAAGTGGGALARLGAGREGISSSNALGPRGEMVVVPGDAAPAAERACDAMRRRER
jgi:hypothetical protein